MPWATTSAKHDAYGRSGTKKARDTSEVLNRLADNQYCPARRRDVERR